MQYGFQPYAGRRRSRGEFVRLPEGAEQPFERLRKHYFGWIFFWLVFMFSESFGFGLLLALFSFVVY